VRMHLTDTEHLYLTRYTEHKNTIKKYMYATIISYTAMMNVANNSISNKFK